jgi:hypothetical protein
MVLVFKLKKANAPSRLAVFDVPPSWEQLASRITQYFDIPLGDVGVAFVDENKETVVLVDEQELQYFYKSFFQSAQEKIKFVVQNLQTPDGESAFS